MAGFDLNTPLGQEFQSLGYGPNDNLPRGILNANPGNITDGAFAQSLPGYAGSDGRFARFNSLSDGANAMDRLLQSYASKGLNTPAAIANRWAPSGDGDNNPNAYATSVAGRLGIGPTDPIDMTDPAQRRALAHAMTINENGAPAQKLASVFGVPSQGGSPMAYAGNDDGSSDGAPAAINAVMQGRSGSTGGMTPATSDDNSTLRNMLARASFGGLGSNNNTAAPETDDPVEKFGNGLTRFGASLMARDNPSAAYVLLNGIKAQAKANSTTWKDLGDTGDGQYRLQQDDKGNLRTVVNPAPDTPTPEKDDRLKATAPMLRDFQKSTMAMKTTGDNISDINYLEKELRDNNLSINYLANGEASIRNLTGTANVDSDKIKSLERIAQRIRTNLVTTEAGPTTQPKLKAAWDTYFPLNSNYDPAEAIKNLDLARRDLYNNYATLKSDHESAISQYRGLPSADQERAFYRAPGTVSGGDFVPVQDWYDKKESEWSGFRKNESQKTQDFIDQHLKQNSPGGKTPGTPARVDFLKSYGRGGGAPQGAPQGVPQGAPQGGGPVGIAPTMNNPDNPYFQ